MDIEQVLKDFKQELYHFVLKHIRDEATAKDIHQEILIKIFSKHQTLKQKHSLKSWIYQIARNSITDYYRKVRYNHPELSENHFTSLEETTEEDELIPCITPFMQQLRPNHKQALEYIELGSYSQKELAEKMNLSYSGAKSTVQRARLQLRKVFDQCCKIEADKYGAILSVTPKAGCSCS